MGSIRWTPTGPAPAPVYEGKVVIQNTTTAVAETFRKNEVVMGPAIANDLIEACNDPAVLERVKALGADPSYVYQTGEAVQVGKDVHLPYKLFAVLEPH